MAGELPRRPRRRPGENRERLIEAGIVEFGVRGYLGAATAAIASAAGVPQPHVYASFATKRELFLACVERMTEHLGAAAGGDAATDEDAAAAEHDTRWVRLLLQAVAALGEDELRDELRRTLVRLRERLGSDAFDHALTRAAAASLG